MKVFKFGGASVKDAKAIENMADILNDYKSDKIMIIVSAMGKSTNALEIITDKAFNNFDYEKELEELKSYHLKITDDLFENKANDVFELIERIFEDIQNTCENFTKQKFDQFYDAVVSFGELLSTKIIFEFLIDKFSIKWLDAGEYIITDANYRDAAILWDNCKLNVENNLIPLFEQYDFVLSQGFVGKNPDGFTTTLGREGSDFTGAIFAHLLNAESLTIWKDVDGLLNADPKLFNETQLIKNISYRETIELAFYGAKIIHPKTIQPLQNKKIPLYVKSFLNKENNGSLINSNNKGDTEITSFIFKENQVLISIIPKDFSFVDENNLAIIFERLAHYGLKVNLMQNSAISFSFSVDNKEDKIANFIVDLNHDFNIRYNEDLELITIRHYDEESIDKMTSGRKIYLEQKSRTTVQYLLK